jgi:hypothetical protein
MEKLSTQEINEISGGGVPGITYGNAFVGWYAPPKKVFASPNIPQPIFVPFTLAR